MGDRAVRLLRRRSLSPYEVYTACVQEAGELRSFCFLTGGVTSDAVLRKQWISQAWQIPANSLSNAAQLPCHHDQKINKLHAHNLLGGKQLCPHSAYTEWSLLGYGSPLFGGCMVISFPTTWQITTGIKFIFREGTDYLGKAKWYLYTKISFSFKIIYAGRCLEEKVKNIKAKLLCQRQCDECALPLRSGGGGSKKTPTGSRRALRLQFKTEGVAGQMAMPLLLKSLIPSSKAQW